MNLLYLVFKWHVIRQFLRGDVRVNRVVSGRNKYAIDKHEAARQAYLDSVFLNKLRQGPSFLLIKQSTAQFKLALRYCKQHEDMMRADAAASLASNDYRQFWNSMQKSSSSRASKFINIVDGYTEDSAIVDRWRRHFKQFYNSVCNNASTHS